MVYQSTSAHLSPSEPQSDLFLLPHSLGPRDQLLVVVNKDKDKVCVCVCVWWEWWVEDWPYPSFPNENAFTLPTPTES